MDPSSTSTERATNLTEISVSELSGALKRTIEDRFGFVRVRGEISNYRGPHSSGHAYFCLKDETARIDAVVWKMAFQRLKTKPQEGLEVIATGRVTTYPGKSAYQIIIDSIEPAGVGALMAILEARRKTLATEGLFDESRKKRIPFLPNVIGVVTSPTGAVIRDILHRIEDRFPIRVVLWPARVQGDTAATEVAAGVTGLDALPPGGDIPRPDLLIVARGGGSLEDLWAFNEEIVVRAVAACSIPVISAVGHETDWTLIDQVADLRAPTPSGAAEKAVPVRADLLHQHADLALRLHAGALRHVDRRRGDVRALTRALPMPEMLTAIPRQRLDRAGSHLTNARTSAADRRRLALVRLGHRLAQQAPLARLAQKQHEVNAFESRMVFAVTRTRENAHHRGAHNAQRLSGTALSMRRDLKRAVETRERIGLALSRAWLSGLRTRQDRLSRFEQLLDTLGYRQVLARGFALVRDAEGRPLRAATDVPSAGTLDIEFADGHIEVATGAARSYRPRKSVKPRIEQESLF